MQKVSVPAAVRGAATASSFGVIAEVALSLRGEGDITDAIGDLIGLFSAERAIVARIAGDRERRLGMADRSAGKLFSNRRPPCLATGILAATDLTMLPGTVLVLSGLLADGLDDELRDTRETCANAGIHDAAVIVLGLRADGYDVIELHFCTKVDEASEALLDAMGPALSRCWSHRLPGSAQAMMERARCRAVGRAGGAPEADILSPENPAGLSRSEFRICAMIREGMMSNAISKELGIQRSTIRTHLHSIYAKTGTSGHIELVHRLTGPRSGRSTELRRLARLA